MTALPLNPGPSMATETVIFLGAGASKADGAPLQTELFAEYFRNADIQVRVDREMEAGLTRYFRRLWGIDVAGDLAHVTFPTFEEALGILDLSDSRREAFGGLGDDRHFTSAQELRNHLTSLISLIIQEKLRGECPNHRRLLQNLSQVGWLRRTSFLSLNYDILIDNAIERGSINTGHRALPDYGVQFTPVPHANGFPFHTETLLLKLHGSLNWLYCPACNSLCLFPDHKVAADLPGVPWRFRCQQCHELQVPVLIPPTFFKVMSNYFLQQIWHRAEETLRSAERIVFCGYSFPDADLHIKYLLKRAEVNRAAAAPRIFILNEHPGKTDEARQMEKDRYARFFRQKDQVIWVNAGFQEFAANPDIVQDNTRWERLG